MSDKAIDGILANDLLFLDRSLMCYVAGMLEGEPAGSLDCVLGDPFLVDLENGFSSMDILKVMRVEYSNYRGAIIQLACVYCISYLSMASERHAVGLPSAMAFIAAAVPEKYLTDLLRSAEFAYSITRDIEGLVSLQSMVAVCGLRRYVGKISRLSRTDSGMYFWGGKGFRPVDIILEDLIRQAKVPGSELF